MSLILKDGQVVLEDRTGKTDIRKEQAVRGGHLVDADHPEGRSPWPI